MVADRVLKTFTSSFNRIKFNFGDYILFKEYKSNGEISKPILAIYLGSFVVDMAVGFNYVKWVNENRYTLYGHNKTKVYNEVGNIDNHLEWSDEVDILGHWVTRPAWKEILAAYRKMNFERMRN